jgi:hypothetical protein
MNAGADMDADMDMTKYQYELNIDIYLKICLLFCAPFNGDGCGESHGGSFYRVCDDHLAETETEPAAEPVAFAEPAVEPAVAFAGGTE